MYHQYVQYEPVTMRTIVERKAITTPVMALQGGWNCEVL